MPNSAVHKPFDFRSDTATRPTPAMRQAMAEAEVGDDMVAEDPTVNRLQERLAEMLGKEAALFVPSGTMSNQIGVRIHCQPGDEFICEAECHIYNYEQGGFAQLSSLVARTVQGNYGHLHLDQLRGLIRPDNQHLVRTRLVSLENTHNRGSGAILRYDDVSAICEWAHEHGLATHLDGARLFNAVVASGISAERWASHFDTVSVCFSKGLGAPIGSALAGSRELIAKAHRVRKLFGGAMRQAGIIAAGALYALDHHIERLAIDHTHAKQFADAVRRCPGLELRPSEVQTNLVIFHIDPSLGTAAELAARLKAEGLLVGAFGPQQIRAVTHLDLSTDDVAVACEILQRVVSEVGTTPAPAAVRGAYA